MDIHEAKAYLNQSVQLSWLDRRGHEVSDCVLVLDVSFVPLYGPCFITTNGDIRLDRITACELVAERAAS
jgi:hypothetical protein